MGALTMRRLIVGAISRSLPRLAVHFKVPCLLTPFDTLEFEL